MNLPQLSEVEVLLTFLLAVLLDKGGVAQFSDKDLAEAAYRVAGKRVLIRHEDLPDGSIVVRLVD